MTYNGEKLSKTRGPRLRLGTPRSNNEALSEAPRLFEGRFGNRIFAGSEEDKAIQAMEQLAKSKNNPNVKPDHSPGSGVEVLKRTPLVDRPYPTDLVNGVRQATYDGVSPVGRRSFPKNVPSTTAPAMPWSVELNCKSTGVRRTPQQQALVQTHTEAARSLLRGPTKYGPSMDRNDWYKLYKAKLCDLAARGWPVWLVRCVAEKWAHHSFPHGLPESDADTVVSQAFEIVGIVDHHRTTDRHSVDLALSQAERLTSLEHFVRVALEVKCRPWMIRPMIHAEAKFRFGDDIPREDVNGTLDKALNRPT